MNVLLSALAVTLAAAISAAAQTPLVDSSATPHVATTLVSDSSALASTPPLGPLTDSVITTRSVDDSARRSEVAIPVDSAISTDSVAPLFSQADSSLRLVDSASARGVRRMETTVVRGKLRGKLLGRKERKDADNRKDVISQESIQEHPDPDVADALQRVPGVTLQRSHGEGHMVQIRGSEPRLSTVTLNGQKMTSTSADTRAASLDVIPIDQLAEIEVAKVLMPEMDGDAIGGTVNLVTQSAQDTQLVAKGLFAGGYNDLAGRPLWQGSGALSKRFFEDGALGVYLGGSYFRNHTRTDMIGIEWDTMPGYNDVVWNLDMRRYLKTRERTGLSGRLDWKSTEGSVLFLTGSWNRMQEDYVRERLTIHREGAPQRDPTRPDSFMTDDALKYSRQAKLQSKEENVAQSTLGATSRLGPALFDLSFTGSRSRGSQSPSLSAIFSPQHQMGSYIDPSNPDLPRFSNFYYPRPAAIDPRFGQSSEYRLDQILSTWKQNGEDDLHSRLDASIALGSDSTVQLKTGGKWGWSRKNQKVGSSSIKPMPKSAPMLLSSFVSSDSSSGFHDGNYSLGPMPDMEAIQGWIATTTTPMDSTAGSDKLLQDDPQNFSLEQHHLAGYVQSKWKEGDLSAVGGLRAERYEILSTGNVVEPQSNQTWSGTTQATSDRTFNFVLPMASMRWSPDPSIVVRASYTRSFALPDAMDLLPTVRPDFLDLTCHLGNPNLDPTLADAGEVDLEWYRNPRGLASFGVFAKRLTDYIFPSVWGEWDKIRKAPFTYFSKVNGDEAFLSGIELEAQQPFDFLPGFLSGFGFEGNYTWTHSVTTLPGRTHESTLPGQSDHVANLGLRYDLKGFTTVVAWNWQSPFLFQVGNAARNDTWVDHHRRLDVSMSQRFGKGVMVYGRVANLIASPYRLYMGDTSHPTQIENPAWSMESGLRISL